jgi:hypothetical protein
MCWKKQVINWEHSNKVALLLSINDYKGTENDLSGCNNDMTLAKGFIPDFQIRQWMDAEVLRKTFREQLLYAKQNAVSGDVIIVAYSGHGSYVPDIHGDEPDKIDETLYLYDGNFDHDEIEGILKDVPDGILFVLFLDSCFSGNKPRDLNSKIRFMPPKESLPSYNKVKRAIRSLDNVIVFSACAENETSADAEINGTFNGAFSYYLWNTLKREYTYREWFKQVCLYLPNKNFEQHPQIEGNDELLDKVVFT